MNNSKPLCKYGAGCYQKNPSHKVKYSHPSASTTTTKPQQVSATNDASSTTDIISEEQQKRRRDRSTDSDGSSSSSDAKIARHSSSPPPPTDDGGRPQSPQQTSHIDATEKEFRTKLLANVGSSFTMSNDGPARPNDIDFISGCFDFAERPYSQRSEHRELLKDSAHFIRDKFLVQMPDDFYKFWEFCKQQCKDGTSPTKVVDLLKPFDWQLVGPFDVLSGGFDDAKMFEPGDYLRHWRFFYDPPEFQVGFLMFFFFCLLCDLFAKFMQTIIVQRNSGLHYGYWRDTPADKMAFVAKNDVAKGCAVQIVADNIFSVVM